MTDGCRLILPAFGAYASGLDALDPAIRGLFGRRAEAHVRGSERVVRLPIDRLAAVDPRT
ncbi:MAG: hypothetical protein HYR63_09340 [Proteobacteria bacterium]|nr:hypothetical protein [Pseudomonadota bacterium]MBI3497516.1 hypothetical protein [Pseudomonadota bacterium]